MNRLKEKAAAALARIRTALKGEKRPVLPSFEMLDCTLRDGSYALNFRFTVKDTEAICSALDGAGLRYVEVGHGNGLGAYRKEELAAAASDEAYLRAARPALRRAKMGALFAPYSTLEDLRLARDCGLDFVRIMADAYNPERKRDAVAEAKRLGLEVSVNFVRTPSADVETFLQAARRAEDWGADTVCVVDSAGCMLPDEVTLYVGRLSAVTKAKVGFHGHNNLMLAVANSVAAIRAGATMIDSTLRGIGKSAGNAQTEVLLAVLRRMGCDLPYDLLRLSIAAEALVSPLMTKPQGLHDIDVLCGMSRFLLDHDLEKIHKEFPRLDLRELIVRVVRRRGVNPTVEHAMEEARQLAEEG